MIDCFFCGSNNATIKDTKKNKKGKVCVYFCNKCKSSVFFPESFKDVFCGNILFLNDLATDYMRETFKEKEYDFSKPIINRYLCTVCQERTTRITKCKKKNFLYIPCNSCCSKCFVKEEFFYIYDLNTI